MENNFNLDHEREKKAAFTDASPEGMGGAKSAQEAGEVEQADKSIKLSLDFEGRHYDGTITPSGKRGANGVPVYFRVMLGDSLFAYICCTDNGWRARDGQQQHNGLVTAIGNYIMEYYE
ncbi:MAG TPA: hypothetical protein VHE54_19485 [Puia sp.]|nr:hypothetical protein [Puia sp.]